MNILRKFTMLIIMAIIGLLSAAMVIGTFAVTAPIAVLAVVGFLLYTLGSFMFAVVRGVFGSH